MCVCTYSCMLIFIHIYLWLLRILFFKRLFRSLGVGLAGFGLPSIAWNACVVSDSTSRYCREDSVIEKACPSRKSALFNKQCPLKKFKIYQRRNAASRVPISVLELAETELTPPFPCFYFVGPLLILHKWAGFFFFNDDVICSLFKCNFKWFGSAHLNQKSY